MVPASYYLVLSAILFTLLSCLFELFEKLQLTIGIVFSLHSRVGKKKLVMNARIVSG